MDNSDEPIRVYILDGHDVVLRGLRELLEDEGMAVVGEGRTAAEATAGIPALRPHVAVLAARLRDGTGPDVCRRIRSTDRSIICLILAEDHDRDGLRDAVLAGASGYLLKQLTGRDIAASVRRAAAGEVLFDPEEEALILSGALETAEPTPRIYDGLTPKESRVLELLGQGMTNRQIAHEMALAEKTAKNYVSDVEKLGLENRTRAALYLAQSERDRQGENGRGGAAGSTPRAGAASASRVRTDPP